MQFNFIFNNLADSNLSELILSLTFLEDFCKSLRISVISLLALSLTQGSRYPLYGVSEDPLINLYNHDF